MYICRGRNREAGNATQRAGAREAGRNAGSDRQITGRLGHVGQTRRPIECWKFCVRTGRSKEVRGSDRVDHRNWWWIGVETETQDLPSAHTGHRYLSGRDRFDLKFIETAPFGHRDTAAIALRCEDYAAAVAVHHNAGKARQRWRRSGRNGCQAPGRRATGRLEQRPCQDPDDRGFVVASARGNGLVIDRRSRPNWFLRHDRYRFFRTELEPNDPR